MRILFTKRKAFNPLSWLIMKIEKAHYSHVVIYFETNLGPIIFESSVHGVVATSYAHFIKKNIVVDFINLNPFEGQEKTMFKRALELIGTKFSVIGLIGAGVSRVFRLGKNIFNDGSKTEFCSEFVYDVLDEAFILNGFDPEYDGPKKLNELLKEYLCQKN